MGNFIKKNTDGVLYYDTLTKKTFKNIIGLQRKMHGYKFTFAGKASSGYVFYDTKDNLLYKAGILFYRRIFNGKHTLVLEKLLMQNRNVSSVRKEEIFVHDINPKDTPREHSYYILLGLNAMFPIQLNIDLENVIKKCTEKIIIKSKSKVLKVFNGNGFKTNLFLEKIMYFNKETQRKVPRNELAVKMDCGKTYVDEFNKFVKDMEVKCKEIIPIKQSRFNYAMTVTRQIAKSNTKKFDKSKIDKKEKNIENQIID